MFPALTEASKKNTREEDFMNLKSIALSGAAGFLALGTAWAADPVKIGVVTPLTGTYAGIGQQVRWGLELAAKEVNAAGGIMGARSSSHLRTRRPTRRSRYRRPRSCSRSARSISSPAR
jgi:ABC-type branched-subunit amino acid transport system substrate-binding protein